MKTDAHNDDTTVRKKKKNQPTNISRAPAKQQNVTMREHENNHHEFYTTMELHNVTMGGA
jgi:hypothetical protein